jgi:hypothetical protein
MGSFRERPGGWLRSAHWALASANWLRSARWGLASANWLRSARWGLASAKWSLASIGQPLTPGARHALALFGKDGTTGLDWVRSALLLVVGTEAKASERIATVGFVRSGSTAGLHWLCSAHWDLALIGANGARPGEHGMRGIAEMPKSVEEIIASSAWGVLGKSDKPPFCMCRDRWDVRYPYGS